MKIVVLDRATLGDDTDLMPIEEIAETKIYNITPPDKVIERIEDADVVITNKIKLNEVNLCAAKALKLICVTATGYDNIDTEYCRSRGIALYNVPGYSTESVAQLTLSMVLSLVCHINEYREHVHSGKYSASETANMLSPVYHELSSLKWGVVGGGAIGSRVAKIAEALGADVYMCRRKKESVYKQLDIDSLCSECDIITLHVALNGDTRGMITRERIAKMKKTAILVNVSRGAVTDEEALAEAIEIGKLGGLGVDVYTKEPFPNDHPYSRILKNPNVILTPHMAWGAYEARCRCVKIVAENIKAFFEGKETNRIV